MSRDLEALSAAAIDRIRVRVETNRRTRQVIERAYRIAMARAYLLGQRDADNTVAADAWDEGERHESRYLDAYGQFCPHRDCNPYRPTDEPEEAES